MMLKPAHVNVASSSVLRIWKLGFASSGCSPRPVCSPIMKQELIAMDEKIMDGSRMKRMVVKGQAHSKRSALITPNGNGGLPMAPQTSDGSDSVRNGRTESSLAKRRAEMTMMVQNSIGADS